jgi:hypothetical protein
LIPPPPLTPAQSRERLQRAAEWLRQRETDCIEELARIREARRDNRYALHLLNQAMGRT